MQLGELQLNQILRPEQLFLWAKENINGMTMYYVTEEEIITQRENMIKSLLQWSTNCTTVLFQMEILLEWRQLSVIQYIMFTNLMTLNF